MNTYMKGGLFVQSAKLRRSATGHEIQQMGHFIALTVWVNNEFNKKKFKKSQRIRANEPRTIFLGILGFLEYKRIG